MKEGLCNIMSGAMCASEAGRDRHTKFMARKDCILATILLFVEPSFYYLIGSPEDPVEVWMKLAYQFQKKTWANKLELQHRLYLLILKFSTVFLCLVIPSLKRIELCTCLQVYLTPITCL